MRAAGSMLVGLYVMLLSACNIAAPIVVQSPTPDQQIISSPVPPATRIATSVSPTPAPTIAEAPTLAIATATATDTPIPPSPTLKPTATSPFFEYVVQPNDSMFYVIQLPQHGHRYDADVAATVVALNDNIVNVDFLPVGETIYIPRPTTTATAVGARATVALLATIGVDGDSGAILPSGAVVGCYEVQEGDSLVEIATQYNTTLEVLSNLNREIDWFGCAFTEPSGGPDCNPNIQIGQCIFVPQPTPLPSKTPTPTGDETMTPTATRLAPRLLFPTNGATVPPGLLILQWVGISGLSEADTYLIEIVDQTTNTRLNQVSQSNALRVPNAFAPRDGQARRIQWRVSVSRSNDQGVYAYVGAPGQWQSFQWLGN